MVSEETTNKLKNELVEIVKKPLTDKARINAYNAKYRKWVRIPDLRNEGVNRQFLDNLWAEVTEEFGAEDDAEQKREVERLYNNRIKKFFNYDGRDRSSSKGNHGAGCLDDSEYERNSEQTE